MRAYGAGFSRRNGWWCWAWWRFEVREDPRPQELRLAELGELTDEEIAAIAERANVGRTRIGTPAEHYGPTYFPDRDAVELWEQIQRVMKR